MAKKMHTYKRIPLTQGKVAIVDVDDYEWLSAMGKWCLNSRGYAVKTIQGNKTLLMHRAILNTPDGLFSDHINKNRLDNRRANLRSITPTQSDINRSSWSTSGFRGVTKSRQKWQARITYSGIDIHLGMFNTKEEAATAYDDAAKNYHGNFAQFNFRKG